MQPVEVYDARAAALPRALLGVGAGLDPLRRPSSAATTMGRALRAVADRRLVLTLARFAKGVVSAVKISSAFAVGTLPETPSSFEPREVWAWHDAGLLALGLLDMIDMRPVSFLSENDGSMFVNLTAQPDVRKSVKSLSGHTDAVFHCLPNEFDGRGISPAMDALVLIGLRNPQRTPTRIAPLAEIRQRIDELTLNILSQPNFVVSAQQSFTGLRGAVRQGMQILAEDSQWGACVRFSHGRIAAIDGRDEAVEALDRFKEAIGQSFRDIIVEPGDLLFINNRTAIHGRAALDADHFGSNSRWLLRGYGYRRATLGIPKGIKEEERHIMLP